MSKKNKPTKSSKHNLKDNQSLLVLSELGEFLCLYAQRGEKVFKIEWKRNKQKTTIMYIDDLELLK